MEKITYTFSLELWHIYTYTFYFQEDIHHQGKISTLLSRIANYHAGIEPNTSEKRQVQKRVS